MFQSLCPYTLKVYLCMLCTDVLNTLYKKVQMKKNKRFNVSFLGRDGILQSKYQSKQHAGNEQERKGV